jgi:RimJ/RimL family protein N-acetyltransferase
MPEIRTPRLRLVRASPEMLHAELESVNALARALAMDVAAGWPPEFYDADAVRWTLRWMAAHPDQLQWSFYYLVEHPAEGERGDRLIGAGGYKGGPDESGAVEIGYAVVAERRRRGFAREAVDGLLALAFAERAVARVIAHTLVELAPSIAVLRSAGFRFVGEGHDPIEPSAVQYEITRDEYDRSLAERHAVDLSRAGVSLADELPSSR